MKTTTKQTSLDQIPTPEQGLALFDFDGTLTTRDSFVAFIIDSQPLWKLLFGALCLLPSLSLYACSLVQRQTMKERALQQFFGKWPAQRLNQAAERFASKRLDSLLRPEVGPLLEWHKEKGHCCVLVSASIESYLIPWAQRHGFCCVLASQPQVEGGLITGRLNGKNCWGPEKVRRIQSWLDGRKPVVTYAYGDTRGDAEMLDYAQHRFYRQLPRH